MSNFDRAVKALENANLPGRTLHPRQVQAVAAALEAAGLLAPDFTNVTRLTVVGSAGRLFETWGITNVAVALQDDGQTLKIFYREEQGNE